MCGVTTSKLHLNHPTHFLCQHCALRLFKVAGRKSSEGCLSLATRQTARSRTCRVEFLCLCCQVFVKFHMPPVTSQGGFGLSCFCVCVCVCACVCLYVCVCVCLCVYWTGEHRGMGPSISKIRSLKMDRKVWTEELIQVHTHSYPPMYHHMGKC